MLANLLNPPKNEQEWLWYIHDHRDSHDRIRAAIKQKYGVDLTDYIVEPMDMNNPRQFLQYNASLHTDMNAIVRSQSSNLLDVNFKSPEELQAWFSLHYQEHENVEQLLGIGG